MLNDPELGGGGSILAVLRELAPGIHRQDEPSVELEGDDVTGCMLLVTGELAPDDSR